MTHQEKLDFVSNNILSTDCSYNPPKLIPYGVSGIASRLGVSLARLIAGDNLRINQRLDRLCQCIELGLKVGIPKDQFAVLDEQLTIGIVEDEDCHFSLSNAIVTDELSDYAFYAILQLSMKIIAGKLNIKTE